MSDTLPVIGLPLPPDSEKKPERHQGPSADDLLPGRMTLAAPTLLTVQDRTRPTLFVNVLLRREGRSQELGASGGLPSSTRVRPCSSSRAPDRARRGCSRTASPT